MSYDLAKLPLQTLLRPVADVSAALARLDERVARSPVGAGWIERSHFADACASLWVDGELVNLEDLVLHDASRDVRAPSHELTIAADVLKTRRRIAAQPAGWALSAAGLSSLCRAGIAVAVDSREGEGSMPTAVPTNAETPNGEVTDRDEDAADPLAGEFAAIDALLARTETVIAAARAPGHEPERDPLVYEPDWDEAVRLDEWRAVLSATDDLPPVLQAVLVLDAWNTIAVLQHAPWLGRLLSAAVLRRAGLSTTGHLAALNLGLKSVPVERRRHRDPNTRLSAILHGFVATAEQGLKELDRLTLARTVLERRLVGRRASSKLPGLIDLALARPLVSAEMVAEALEVTPRAALRLVGELGLREMTGRGRFRAWGIV